MRHRVAKAAAPSLVLKGQTALFPEVLDRLLDMPLPKGRVAKAHLVFGPTYSVLSMSNLEGGDLFWKLGLARTAKADAQDMAASFNVFGSRHVNSLAAGVPAEPATVIKVPEGGAPALDGVSEFGLQTPDVHEYFLSKFGDLVGVVLVKRTATGWSAGLAKSNVPRVLSKEAVAEGLMPPPGSSALPRSLESVVPAEYHYWKASGDEARAIRDAFVEASFFSDDTIKAVDGELRKVEVKYYLYEPQTDVAAAPLQLRAPSFGDRVTKIVPPEFVGKAFTPMSENDGDWLEALDKGDAEDTLAILSPGDRTASAREMVRAAQTLKGAFLLEHDNTHANRCAFAQLGPVFKLAGEPTRVFVASFVPEGVIKAADGPVSKTVDFQGIRIDIDRPLGFVQTGKDADGNDWSRTYQNDYGFIPKTNGGDGGSLDVFLGDDPKADTCFWVTQNKADGSFDEYKLFLGFPSERDALSAFAAHIPPRFFGDVAAVPVNSLKAMLNLDPTILEKRVASYVRKINGLSYDQLRSVLQDAIKAAYPEDPTDSGSPCCGPGGMWITDMFDDSVIFEKAGATWQDAYTYANGAAQCAGSPVEVVRGWMPKASLGTAKAFKSASAPTAPVAEPARKALERVLRAPVFAAEEQELAKRVIKAVNVNKDGEEHYVLGVVLEPDVIDAQQDTYSEAEVRSASERFMEHHRNMGLMHKGHVNDKVQILENYIAPSDFHVGDMAVKKGSWMMAVRVNDKDLWAAIKGGDLTGFSIGGSAIRKPVEEGV